MNCWEGVPGGAFDPLGLASDSSPRTAKLREAEIKHGRLAMVAFLGVLCCQNHSQQQKEASVTEWPSGRKHNAAADDEGVRLQGLQCRLSTRCAFLPTYMGVHAWCQTACKMSLQDKIALHTCVHAISINILRSVDLRCLLLQHQGEGALGSLAKFASTFSTELAEKIDPNY